MNCEFIFYLRYIIDIYVGHSPYRPPDHGTPVSYMEKGVFLG
jgi:hypothetical protein